MLRSVTILPRIVKRSPNAFSKEVGNMLGILGVPMVLQSLIKYL
jgi:hypothetical protein